MQLNQYVFPVWDNTGSFTMGTVKTEETNMTDTKNALKELFYNYTGTEEEFSKLVKSVIAESLAPDYSTIAKDVSSKLVRTDNVLVKPVDTVKFMKCFLQTPKVQYWEGWGFLNDALINVKVPK